MSTNEIGPARSVDVVPAATTVSNDVRVLGSMIGVAQTNGVIGGNAITYAIEGEWLLPKATGIGTVNVGDKLLWDISAVKLTNTGAATGDILNAAIVMRAALTGATSVRVKLNPGGASISA